MPSQSKTIQTYYEGWLSKSGNMDKSIFADNFKFKGPMGTIEDIDAFHDIVKKMAPGVSNIVVRAQFTNDLSQVCTIIDFITEAPIKATTSCAEIFTLENDKIKNIELIYDSLPWAGVM